MKKIEIEPVGVIYSPYKKTKNIPFQGYMSNKNGTIKIFKKYEKGLENIDGFSHLIILYYFHKVKKPFLIQKPFMDDKPKGIFAIRHPNRPNRIGLSVVKLIKRKGNKLKIGNIDVLDKTPLLDIKPYVPKFDTRRNVSIGWFKGKI